MFPFLTDDETRETELEIGSPMPMAFANGLTMSRVDIRFKDETPEQAEQRAHEHELYYAYRSTSLKPETPGKEYISLVGTRSGTPLYAIECLIELPNKLITGPQSLIPDAIFPFLDEDDHSHFQATLLLLLFSIEDLSLIPYTTPPEQGLQEGDTNEDIPGYTTGSTLLEPETE